MNSSILLRLACVAVTVALPSGLRAEEGLDLRRMADQLPPDRQGVAQYLRTINRIVDRSFSSLQVADRNALKQEAVERLLTRLQENPVRRLNTEYLVRQAYARLYVQGGAGARPVRIEGLDVAALAAPGSVLDDLEGLPRADRRQAVDHVLRLERDHPQKLGDLLAYVAAVRCQALDDDAADSEGPGRQLQLLNDLKPHLPKAVGHARAVLADPPRADTLYRRVFRFFGTLATGAGYLALTGVALFLVGLALSSLQPPPPLAKVLPARTEGAVADETPASRPVGVVTARAAEYVTICAGR